MVRSPHAHARIRSIDIDRALAVPGVLAVLTGHGLARRRPEADPAHAFSWHPADIAAASTSDGSRAVHGAALSRSPDDKVRFVGEAVAMVIAETLAAAQDGAELVDVDYELLHAGHRHGRRPRSPDAPRVWEDTAPTSASTRTSATRGDRSRVRARRAYREVRDLGAARHRRADGAARRGRRTTIPRPATTRSTPAAAARAAEERSRDHARRAGGRRARRHRTTSAAISARAA